MDLKNYPNVHPPQNQGLGHNLHECKALWSQLYLVRRGSQGFQNAQHKGILGG